MTADGDESFTVKIASDQRNILNAIAYLRGKESADLVRDYIIRGIAEDLDEKNLIRSVNEQRERLLAAAKEMREKYSGKPDAE